MKERAHILEEIEYNGQQAYKYSDGSIRNKQGHWLARHPGGAGVIDGERSKQLHARKAEIKRQREAEYHEEVQRALVRKVARGRGTVAQAGAKLVENLAGALAPSDAVKEHGIRNYKEGVDYVLRQAQLVKEKEQGTINIDKAVIAVDAGERARTLRLLLADNEAEE